VTLCAAAVSAVLPSTAFAARVRLVASPFVPPSCPLHDCRGTDRIPRDATDGPVASGQSSFSVASSVRIAFLGPAHRETGRRRRGRIWTDVI